MNFSVKFYIFLMLCFLNNAEAICIKNIKVLDKNKMLNQERKFTYQNCIIEKELSELLVGESNKLKEDGFAKSDIKFVSKSDDELILEIDHKYIDKVEGTNGFLVKKSSAFNIKEIDQAIEQANKVQSIYTKVDIQEKENTVDVKFQQYKLKKLPIIFKYFANNQGQGRSRKHNFSFDIDNKLGFYERLNVVFGIVDRGLSRAVNFYLPIYDYTLKLKYNDYTNKSLIKGEYYTRYGQTKGIELEKTFYRTETSSFKGNADFEVNVPRKYISGYKERDYPLAVSRFSVSHDYFSSFNNSSSFIVSKSVKGFGEQIDKRYDDYKYHPRNQFIKFELNNNFSKNIFNNNYTLVTNFQKSSRYLISQEQVSLSSFSNIRGYFDDTVSTDSAAVIKQDYSIFKITGNQLKITPFVFFDYGVGNFAKKEGRYYLSSTGFGFNYIIGKFAGDLTITKPLKNNIPGKRVSSTALFLNFRFNGF